MSQIITLKIDVTKFHKDAFYKGEKGTYATVTVFLKDEADHHGQFGMITQDLGKERREAGENGPILGNVMRVFSQDKPRQPVAKAMDQQARDAQPMSRPLNDSDDDIPF